MRDIYFRWMEIIYDLFYSEYHGEMHDSRTTLLIVVLYETHAELKHEIVEFLIDDVRILCRVFDPSQQFQFFIEKCISMHIRIIHDSQEIANQSLSFSCILIMNIVGIIDSERDFVRDHVDICMDPSEDQYSIPIFACFDDIDVGFKYPIDRLRYFEQRIFISDRQMTDFDDLDHVLVDEIFQSFDMIHP